MRILLINQPLNNRGDESAHRALIRAILKKSEKADITVLAWGDSTSSLAPFIVESDRVKYYSYQIPQQNKIIAHIYSDIYNKVVESGYGKWLWEFFPRLKEVKHLIEQSDIIVCAPGGICMGGFQNWGHVKRLSLAKLFNKPLIYYGRSFGPFPTETPRNRAFKDLSLRMLEYMSFIAIRDKKTEQLADSLNIKYTSTVDTAFLDFPTVPIPTEIKKIIGTSRYIVFVPNLLIWHYKYKNIQKDDIVDFYCRMVSVIKKHKKIHKIVMLPQTSLYGTYLNDDINLFNDIANTVNDDNIIVIPDIYGSDLQQTIIREADLLIGARYHSVVFAINNNIPFIALNYEHKIEGLLQTLCKTDCMVDITSDIFTHEGRDTILSKVDALIPIVKPDQIAKDKAQKIAQECFNKFADLYLV